MEHIFNVIEQSLLEDITGLYESDLNSETHSYLHMQCIACSKRAVVNIIARHRQIIFACQSIQTGYTVQQVSDSIKDLSTRTSGKECDYKPVTLDTKNRD